MKNLETTFGLLLHKDEYNLSFILWIKENFAYEKETETSKQLYIYGTEEQLNNIMSLMYKDAEECSKIFPAFKTMDVEFAELLDATKKVTMELTDAYLTYGNSPAYRGGECATGEQMEVTSKILDTLMTLRKLMTENN